MSHLLYTQASDPQQARSLLSAAQNEDSIDDVRRLLDKGVPVDVISESGDTPLISCARANRADLARLLLERGANPNHINKGGFSALLLACRGGHVDVVRCLLEARCNVNAQDKDGRTALMLACQQDADEIVGLLFQRGANVDLTDNSGRSASSYLPSSSRSGGYFNGGSSRSNSSSSSSSSISPSNGVGGMVAAAAAVVGPAIAAGPSSPLSRGYSSSVSGNSSGGPFLSMIRSILDQLKLSYATQTLLQPERHVSLIVHLKTFSSPAIQNIGGGVTANGNCLSLMITIIRNRIVFRTGSLMIPEPRRQSVGEFLLRLNHVMTEGIFEFDFSRGLLRFRSSVIFQLPTNNNGPSPDMPNLSAMSDVFFTLVNYHVNNLEPYFTAVELVAEGQAPNLVFEKYFQPKSA